MAEIIGPTPERVASFETRREGLATRIVPPIDTLKKLGKISDKHHRYLAWYAEQKNICERSCLPDSIGRIMEPRRGHGGGPSPQVVSAAMNVREAEQAMGSLAQIAEAICFDEMTITDWLETQGQTRVRCQTIKGKKVCKPYADGAKVKRALLELKFAADRISGCRAFQ